MKDRAYKHLCRAQKILHDNHNLGFGGIELDQIDDRSLQLLIQNLDGRAIKCIIASSKGIANKFKRVLKDMIADGTLSLETAVDDALKRFDSAGDDKFPHMVDILIKHGASTKNEQVLMKAIAKNNTDIVRLLTIPEKHRINIPRLNILRVESPNNGTTALGYACILRKFEIAKILISEGGADVNAKGNCIRTPFELLFHSCKQFKDDSIGMKDLMEYMMQQGVNIKEQKLPANNPPTAIDKVIQSLVWWERSFLFD